MSEHALAFSELQAHIAVALGVAYYGEDGDEVAQAPTDTPTVTQLNDYINGGIRMFLMDAPREGWRFLQPTASMVLWPTVTGAANGAPVFGDPESTVTVHARTFHDSMLGHSLKFTVTSTADGTPTYTEANGTTVVDVDDAIFSGVFAVGQSITFSATGNSYVVNTITDTTTVIIDGDASAEADADTVTITRNYVIEAVTSALVVDVTGDASGEADGATVTVTADGNYTLPSTFGGGYSGPITYAAGSAAGSIRWSNEGTIRKLRENVSSQTGIPSLVAVRKMSVARRWELAVYPTPGGEETVEFPYKLYFTELTAAADLHPAGAHYDEAIKAACEAYAETHGEDMLAGRAQYYEQKALPAAHRMNRRSVPRRLGSLTKQHYDQDGDWRDRHERPNVTTP